MQSENTIKRLAMLLIVLASLVLAACSSRPARTARSTGKYDPATQIEMLRELRDKGLITDDEFDQKKKRILERN
jgi:uncharacterized membrane protein